MSARPPGPCDLVVRGGTVVTAEGRARVDVGVRDGRVVQLGGEMTGARELDARERFVLPGGVDPHVHINVEKLDDDPGFVDDFASGSAAALAGGVTTLGNMSWVMPRETIADRVRLEAAEVARRAIADVFFHTVIATPTPALLAEVGGAVSGGQVSMKIFMSMPTFEAAAAEYALLMRATGEAGGITLIHCEDRATIECCTAMLARDARTHCRHYAESRPVAAEVVATERAIAMCRATRAPTYIVHLSSAAALAACRAARAEGLPLFVETRPLYLYLTAERYGDDDGAIYVAQPPLRAGDDAEALWRGLADGSIDTVGSDHAPWTRALKLDVAHDVRRARPGVAELDTMLPLLYTEGVAAGRLTLERFVALTATNAARLFGVYPSKGTIAVGSDADLVVWETGGRRLIRDEDLLSRAGHSVYRGREICAWPAATVRRGEVVFQDGKLAGAPGSGRAVPRGRTRAPLPGRKPIPS
ncbi:MAG TPA: amidohydrolase family protein [Polyangia bacterium]|nr:amidohydrolase family protein [Polyangia bacterium]